MNAKQIHYPCQSSRQCNEENIMIIPQQNAKGYNFGQADLYIDQYSFHSYYNLHMTNCIGETSLAVSTSVSRFILNRAKAVYAQRIKTEVLYNKSLEASKDFPLQCTQQLLHLYQYPNSQGANTLIGELQAAPPQSSRDHQRLVRTVKNSPRQSYIKPAGNTVQSAQLASYSPRSCAESMGVARKLVFLAQACDQARQIELMREKKMRRAQLQICFLQAQKLERSKARLRSNDLISSLFTTNFNGERLEIRPTIKKTKKVQSRMQLDMRINEEKEMNFSIMGNQSEQERQLDRNVLNKKKYVILKDRNCLEDRKLRRRNTQKDHSLVDKR